MITVPQLELVQNLDPTDVIIITHANGTSEKITGADFLKGVTPVDAITENDLHPVTSNAVAQSCLPVDTVASGNRHSVSSNAVATALQSYLKNRTDITNMNTHDIFCGSGNYADIANLPTNDFYSFASFGSFQIAVPYQGYNNPVIYVRENTNGYGNWYKIQGLFLS